VEGLEHVHLHSLANRVLPLDVRHGSTAHSEMLGDHAQIVVPLLVVADDCALELLECERGDVVCQFILRKYLCWHFFSIVLIFNDSDNHALQERIRLARVRVRLRQLTIRQRIIAVIKLCNVATKVLDDSELTSWVNLLVTICT